MSQVNQRPTAIILAEAVPGKPNIREPPGCTLSWRRSNEAPQILYTSLQRSGQGCSLLRASSDPHPSSVVIHAVLVLSRAILARFTFARISCAVLVHTKGVGLALR